MLRAVNLRGAVAVNVITMIGIGPLITIPLVLAQLGGPLALLGWIAGAIVALCDGLVWAELGSRYPGSGGTYVFLREVFGRKRAGRLFAFLFNWQFLLYAPFLLASGYIGFANYAAYLVPAIGTSFSLHVAVALGIGLLTTFLLYRRTSVLANASIWLCGAAVLTLVLIVVAALPHFDLHRAFHLDRPLTFGLSFVAGFGGALYITLYDYVGYADAALLGDEVRDPVRTIPRAIVISILLVASLYVALQLGVLGAVPWHTLVGTGGVPAPAAAQFVGSTVVANAWGLWPARIVTALVLVTAFASVFGNLLGFARIPYAAARDGEFFPIFARLHPSGQFPYVSVLVIGALSLIACFFTLDTVIAILTAGIVLIQGVAQIIALFMLRARGDRAPFRMWLFPLPAIVALGGWLLAFCSTGPMPMLLGAGWLVVGTLVYLVVARWQRAWPFAIAALLLAVSVTRADAAAPTWRSWQTSAVVQDHGYPVFTVNRTPFFVFGAAFFYERIPRDQWAESLRAYKRMGINTLDLYLIWNWHEVAPGKFDFTGRTNPRRDLHEVFRLAHQLGFKLIVRPGPVIRNEWRNGGYPAWLLERPEYNMPLHDVLEGRYPATATLQNKQADAAANEWLHNPTHLRYAARWLRTALHEVEPWSHDVIAIALDDDQGAYLDNDTWPAPHWHAYIGWLRSIVQSEVGQRVPLFINTYQMKVTASSPVWAWGNWYQSDAYTIGEHDRAQLDFSTALLQTQSHEPMMVSEFQAGWLQGAGEAEPRPADPTNTALALNEMLGLGVHGIVNFPVQDTIYPSGWEAPWANWSYAWDAALGLEHVWTGAARPELAENRRYYPTAQFGATVAAYGRLLARTHVAADAAIIWPPSLYDERALTSTDVSSLAAAMIREQQDCRSHGLICDAVDLRFASEQVLRRYPSLILPASSVPSGTPMLGRSKEALAHLGSRLVTTAASLHPMVTPDGSDNARLLLANDGSYGFLVYANWGDSRLPASVAVRMPRGVVSIPIDRFQNTGVVPILISPAPPQRTANYLGNSGVIAPIQADFHFAGAGWKLAQQAAAFASDTFGDGMPLIFLQNAHLRIGLSPLAGARVAVLQGGSSNGLIGDFRAGNAATSIGLLRDGVLHQPTPSTRDYIAAYTHDFPAGTFNRPYRCQFPHDATTATVACTYDAPDLPAGGARFTRTITLAPNAQLADIGETLTLHQPDAAQRLVSLSGFAQGTGATIIGGTNSGAFGIFEPSEQRAVIVVWDPGDVDSATVTQSCGAAILHIVFAHMTGHLRMGVVPAATQAEAERALQANRP